MNLKLVIEKIIFKNCQIKLKGKITNKVPFTVKFLFQGKLSFFTSRINYLDLNITLNLTKLHSLMIYVTNIAV